VWDPDGLVAQLRSMPPILTPHAGGGICGDPCAPPPLPPVEEKRKQIYDLLYSFSTASVPALARLLQSVTRGYLKRDVDSEDRRRLAIGLTERGRAAAKVLSAAGATIDAALLLRIGRRILSARTAACLS
jgi:hypothetical protein